MKVFIFILVALVALVVWCIRPFQCETGDEGIQTFKSKIFPEIKDQYLDYMTMHPDAIIRYLASNMILQIHFSNVDLYFYSKIFFISN